MPDGPRELIVEYLTDWQMGSEGNSGKRQRDASFLQILEKCILPV